MADSYSYVERVESFSPNDSGFSLEGGTASITFDISNSQFTPKIKEILGYCETGTSGALKRGLPKAHPVWPWLFADRITSLRGLGAPTVKTASDPFSQLEAPAFDYFALYPQYRVTISFAPRPYVLTRDDKIESETITYNKPDGTTESRTIAKEWRRYCDYEYIPSGQYITAQQGQFLFRVGSSSQPNGQPAGTGQIKMQDQSAIIKWRWYNVPYELLDRDDTSNWILQGLGCVNQYRFHRWAAGTLLFQGANPFVRNTPPVPGISSVTGAAGDTVIFTNNKLCNIEFTFLYRNPTITAAAPAITNNNHIAAGHNLAPFGCRQGWYYMTTELKVLGTPITGIHDQPQYPSYPFECFFSVPS